MAEFVYNNAKIASTGYIPFKVNYGYHSQMSYTENIHPHSKSKLADKLLVELQELMIVCCKNFHHTQKF